MGLSVALEEAGPLHDASAILHNTLYYSKQKI